MKSKNTLKNFLSSMRLPEIRFFWPFLFLTVILIVIDAIYIPNLWGLVNVGALVVLGVGVLSSSYKLATSNIKTKTAAGRLQSIIANLGDGVVAYDNDFKILVFNTSAERIFGIKRDQIIGEYIGPERAGEARLRLLVQTMFPSLAPMVMRQSEVGVYPQIIDISFGERSLRVSTDRILDGDGKILGFVKLVRDRTREVELLKSKSEFITIAAHQLRTPLTAINWIFEGFSKSEDLKPEDRELSGNGLTAARKLLKIVNDLLDVSKIEEGRFGYNFQETNIINFITEILTNAQAEAKEYGIRLYFDKGDMSEVSLMIDPNRLGLALSNLIDNAIRYNVKNGTVTVKIEKLKDKPYIEISIKDTGVGIPPENMKKVFTKFFRAENVVKRETEGSGLGLYITKNIVNRHGGTIRAESIIDRGTTFFITLPTDPKLIPPKEVGLAG